MTTYSHDLIVKTLLKLSFQHKTQFSVVMGHMHAGQDKNINELKAKL